MIFVTCQGCSLKLLYIYFVSSLVVWGNVVQPFCTCVILDCFTGDQLTQWLNLQDYTHFAASHECGGIMCLINPSVCCYWLNYAFIFRPCYITIFIFFSLICIIVYVAVRTYLLHEARRNNMNWSLIFLKLLKTS